MQALLFVLLPLVAFAVDYDILYDYVDIGKNLPPPRFESSGILWLEDRQQVVVVSDTGELCTMKIDGTNVSCNMVSDSKIDMEDLALDPEAYKNRSVIYLAQEHPPKIWEYSLKTKELVRGWDLSGFMKTTRKAGIEALTFVYDPKSNKSDGVFYAGNQLDGIVYIVDLKNSGAATVNATLVNAWKPPLGSNDLAGAYYYPYNNRIYFCIDSVGELVAMDLDGSNVQRWIFDGPTANEEGVFLMGDAEVSSILIADDRGTVYSAKIQYV